MVSWRVKANTYFRPYILYFTPHISILLCLFPLELSKLRIHLKFVRIFYSFHCDTSTKNASNMTSLEFILFLGFVSIRIRSNPFESVRIRLNPFESVWILSSLSVGGHPWPWHWPRQRERPPPDQPGTRESQSAVNNQSWARVIFLRHCVIR